MSSAAFDMGKVEEAAAALEAGGVALIPTDTVYGLAAHPLHPAAQEKIFALKKRPQSLNLQILLPDNLDPATLGAVMPEPATALLADAAVRPLVTMVLALDPERKPDWLSHREEAGFRIPGDLKAQAILGRTGPLFATSANAHGQPPGATPPETLPMLEGKPDAVWDAGPLTGAASTVVNFNAAPPVVLRWGQASDLTRFGLGHA